LFRQLDFRLRKPRPVLAKADPARQKNHKKNSESWGGTMPSIFGH